MHKPKVKLFDKDFTFLKSADEVAGFLNCARTYSQQGFVLYAVAIYTGLRQGELAGLKWSDVDLDRRIITVQRSFTGPTKSGSPRYVPITTALLPILRHWRLKVFGELVFQNAVGKMLHSNCNLFTTDFKACLRAAGFSDKIKKGKTRSYMVFHDLRHTFASQWVMAGGDIFKLQKIMGHESVQMTMRYAHLSPDAFAADFELFNKIAVPVNPGVAIQFPLEITC